jgi:prolyl oligopeptidase PreP (S9A serine peptidase family)
VFHYTFRASPTRVQQKFANEQDGTKRMFFVVAGRHAKVLKKMTDISHLKPLFEYLLYRINT